ncbi:MAG: hypothetical protein HY951_15910 [Bacteroidia bacterium]|nr:hypothetical protein [Bacteroidia bacterium]
MKIFSFIIILFFSINSFAQIKEGFSKYEARDMMALCCSYTFLDIYNTDAEIIPPKYLKRYTSGIFGMDNKYQIYINDKIAVINLRGSTDKKISWLENFSSAMIPAKGIIKISGEKFDYCFAKDSNAAVHAGYALGLAYLHNDILYQINILNKEGIYNFIITGHSQGGALANLLRTYLENLSGNEISKDNKFKTYSFGAPMIGNKQFTDEYNIRYCINNTSFNLINPSDQVPLLPLSYKDTNYLKDNIKTLLFDYESFSIKDALSDGVVNLFEGGITKSVNLFSSSASKQIAKDLGTSELPQYVKDINYCRLGNTIKINPVVYPKILKDPKILKNDSLMKIFKKGTDGYFINKELYKKEPMFFQHKPYNYYTSILKSSFPEEYKLLKNKFLPENL